MDRNYDDYEYDEAPRRSTRRSAGSSGSVTASPRASERRSRSGSSRSYQRAEDTAYSSRGAGSVRGLSPSEQESSSDLLFDARGTRVRKSKVSNNFVKILLYFVLPYLVINGIIFFLVTAAPKISVSVADTDDYRTSKVTIEISGILPLKDVQIMMDSNPLEYEKDGNTYTATAVSNGTVYASATSVNGMMSSAYADVTTLDDTPPVIDETSCRMEDDKLCFTISDSQSGVDFDSIYAEAADGSRSVPASVNREKGLVKIPLTSDKVTIHFADMVGNTREASMTVNEILAE